MFVTCLSITVLGEQEKEYFICHNKTYQFSSRWYICAQKSPYTLHSISQRLPQCCLWNGSNICLIYNGPIVKPIIHWVIRHKHGSYWMRVCSSVNNLMGGGGDGGEGGGGCWVTLINTHTAKPGIVGLKASSTRELTEPLRRLFNCYN